MRSAIRTAFAVAPSLGLLALASTVSAAQETFVSTEGSEANRWSLAALSPG